MKNNPQTWKLTDELFRFTALKEKIPFTLANACEGVCVFGGIGSGKTSGTGTHIPLAQLKAGFGGLVLCAKGEEPGRWRKLAEMAGRGEDVVMFGPAYDHRYNFLEELKRGGAESVIKAVREISEALSGETKSDVWTRGAEQHLRNILDLFDLCGRPFQIPEIRLATSDCDLHETLLRSAPDHPDKSMLEAYFLREWKHMADETRQSILLSLNPALDPFARGDLRQLFCTDTNIRPEDTRTGKIIVINIPILEDKDTTGKAAAIIWKYMLQKRLQLYFGNGMKESDDSTRPVFLFVDESQYFATREDAIAQTSARQARLCMTYLTQNINNDDMRQGRKAREETRSLLGNLQTKILHQNSCADTYRWFNEVIGKVLQSRQAQNVSFHGQGGGGASISIQKDVQLEPRDFQVLAKGDKPFRFCTTAILQQGGKTFKGGKLWTQIVFPQFAQFKPKAKKP